MEWATWILVRATPGESRAGAAEWGPGWGWSEERSSSSHSRGRKGGRHGTQPGEWGRELRKPTGPLTSRKKSREWPAHSNSNSCRRSREEGRPRAREVATQKARRRQKLSAQHVAEKRRLRRPLIAAAQPRAHVVHPGAHAHSGPHARTPPHVCDPAPRRERSGVGGGTSCSRSELLQKTHQASESGRSAVGQAVCQL